MHQTRKGNQWFFGMKAHIGVDAESGLVHTVTTTPANAADVTQLAELLHGKETRVFADAGYTGAEKRAAKRGGITKLPEGRAQSRHETPGIPQGSRAGQVRTSVSGAQAPVRLSESALPWMGEEHLTDPHPIRTLQFMDGATSFAGDGLNEKEHQHADRQSIQRN